MGDERSDSGADAASGDLLLIRLGERIRAARTAAGMSQQDVADASGMKQGFVWRIEAGRQNLTVRNLDRMATAVGTTMSALLDGVTARP